MFSPFSFFVQSCEPTSGPGSRFKGKHSLDSDEEDEGEEENGSKYNILDSDDVEGVCCCLNRPILNTHLFLLLHWSSFLLVF